ncbi:hypothetical protein QJQ45_011623 [Haematococcus lacustris]|nr:hypothetical protein QJQ45_011623 [Haematococcus lacustris]
MATQSRIRGLMCSTSTGIRFYDQDVSAALNIRRIAAGPGRPRELSSWLGRPAMPNPGRPGQEWVLVRDKGLLRKWQRRHQRQRIASCVSCHKPSKQAIQLPLTQGMCVRYSVQRGRVLYQKALAISPLSLCVPYLSFTPSFLVLTAFVFVGEVPSTAGLAGVVVVTLGGYLLSKQGSSSSSTGASNSSSGDKPVTPAKAVSAAHHTPTTHLAGGPASPAGTSPADKVAVVVTCSSPITTSTASPPWAVAGDSHPPAPALSEHPLPAGQVPGAVMCPAAHPVSWASGHAAAHSPARELDAACSSPRIAKGDRHSSGGSQSLTQGHTSHKIISRLNARAGHGLHSTAPATSVDTAAGPVYNSLGPQPLHTSHSSSNAWIKLRACVPRALQSYLPCPAPAGLLHPVAPPACHPRGSGRAGSRLLLTVGAQWEPGALLMLAVAAMWSVTASLDKLGVVHAPSLWVYAALQRLAIGSAAALYLALVSPGSFRLLCSRHLGVLLLLSLAELLAVVLFLEAIKFVFVSYVVAIKRANILMSLIVGGCCFGERVWQRLPAVLIMVSGMLLIITDPSPSFRASSVHQAVGASGSGQQDQGQGQGQGQAAKVVIGERRQVIKAGLRGLVKAALLDLSPAQVDAIVAEINKRMTMGSKQCCLTAVMCLSLLLSYFLGQPSPAQQQQQHFPAVGPAPGPPPLPDPACPPYAHPRLATRSSPRTAAAPAQLPPPVQLDIWDPQLLAQIKNAMELLTNAMIEHMMPQPVAMLKQLDEVHLTGDGNSLNANATTIITSIKEFYRHPGRFINKWGKAVGVVEGGFSREMRLQPAGPKAQKQFVANSLPHFIQFIQYSQLQNSGWDFARRVETDGVSVSVHFVRNQVIKEPVEPPCIGRELTATSDFSAATHIAVGVDPGVTQAIKAAHAMRHPVTGQVLRQWEWELSKGQLKHDSGLTKAKQDTTRWSAAIQPQLQQLAAATPAGTTLDSLQTHILALKATLDPLWEEYPKPRWRRQRLGLHHAQDRVIEAFCKKDVRGLKWCHEVQPNPPPPPPAQHPPAQDPPTPAQHQLAQDPQAPAQDPPAPPPAQDPPPPPPAQEPPPPAQDQPPAQLPSGPVPRPQAPPWGRWLDPDTNPCLNFQCIGESMQRPLDLCSYEGLMALPPIGKEYQQGYKRVNDRLPKVKQRLHRAAEYRRGIDGRARNNAVTLQLHNAEQYRMSFFSKLFRGKSAGPEQLGPNKFCRTATTIVDLDDSDDSDDSVRCSIASSEGAPDDPLNRAVKNVKLCHRGKKATIYEGIDRCSKRPVIVKAFTKQGMTQGKHEKMIRESSMLKVASEVPGVVRLLNVVEDTQSEYHILEYVPGYTLIEVMANNGGLLSESRCVLEVVLPLLRVLAGLHSLGIVHRDIKPEHIMCSHGNIKLVDFCEAAQKSSQCLNHRAGQLEYEAPEVLSKPKAEDIFHEVLFNGMSEEELPQYDEKADIWSAGVVIFEALTGLQPFPTEQPKQLAEMHAFKLGSVSGKGALPSFIVDTKLSASAQAFLNAMLQADPALRWSAEQLLQHPWVVKYASSQHSQWLLSRGAQPPPFPAKQPVIPAAGQALQVLANPLVISAPVHVPVR